LPREEPDLNLQTLASDDESEGSAGEDLNLQTIQSDSDED
jgi:hypothetical protein